MIFSIYRVSISHYKGSDIGDGAQPCQECYWNKDKWEIEINSLNELIKFIKKYSEIILTDDCLCIYDDYIE